MGILGVFHFSFNENSFNNYKINITSVTEIGLTASQQATRAPYKVHQILDFQHKYFKTVIFVLFNNSISAIKCEKVQKKNSGAHRLKEVCFTLITKGLNIYKIFKNNEVNNNQFATKK